MQSIQGIVTMQIPEHLVVVEKEKLLELESQSLKGQTWTSKDLTAKLGGKDIRDWKLFFYKHRSEVDILHGGFVKFPTSKGMPWRFHASRTAEFIDEHWKEIMETKDRL